MDLRALRLALAAACSLGLLPGALAQPEEVEHGRALYERYCLICHGHEMTGSPGSTVYDLRRFPKDARERFVLSVTNGKPPAMPSWKGQFSEPQLDHLWAFVRSGGDPSRPAAGGR